MFSRRLQELHAQRLNRLVKDRSSGQGPRISIDGRELINFASNDYLGFSNHPEIAKAASESIKEFGFGSGASRLLGGGSTLHRELEQKIAEFKGAEAALIFNTGYAANTGIIPSLAGEEDVIFSDELNHASIIDGCRLSKAEILVYRHRDTGHLAGLIEKTKGKRIVIVTDTVFSMDGDIAPLGELSKICRRYNGILYLDDAHGMGVLGNGRGALAHFGIEPEPWVIQMGTCSKALGSFGAFVAGTSDIIEWLINTARSFFFSTALPACMVAASAKAIELIEGKPELIKKLWDNRARLFAQLKDIGFDTGESVTPIIPLKMKSVEGAVNLSQCLYEKGIYAPAIRPPTVKVPRVRITVTAAHSEEDISALTDSLGEIRR